MTKFSSRVSRSNGRGRHWPFHFGRPPEFGQFTKVTVRRTTVLFVPESTRVISKPFIPSGRIVSLVERILAMSDADVSETMASTEELFASRHRDLHGVFERNFQLVAEHLENPSVLSEIRRRLIGAYCTQEYSVDSAALGNPSMVLSPDQGGLRAGEHRFILSLRAIGEGHVSSIEFRSGVIDSRSRISIEPPKSNKMTTGTYRMSTYTKTHFFGKLSELNVDREICQLVLDALPESFGMNELEAAISDLEGVGISAAQAFETARIIHWLASSTYQLDFPIDSDISERVIFPFGQAESHGIEDARFVRVRRNDDTYTYCGTYTAYDGFEILPQLIETSDFLSFKISTLRGPCAQAKGIAMFPRMINGLYTALARHDNENNYLMQSEDASFWHQTNRIQTPSRPWELFQLGNCGSPIETDAGWLVITHGVGPMRRYTLGALLLDRDDPCRVIGHLNEPLLVPEGDERNGYVPNVVYSCGASLFGNTLALPYGFSDRGASIALIALDELLDALTDNGHVIS